MKTRRLNAVTRTLLAIFAMMLFPQSTLAADEVIYYKYVSGTFVESTASSYTTLSGSDEMTDLTLNSGTYVVSGNSVTYRGGIVISGTSEVNIILCDGATLNANRGIAVGYDATLNIYGQEKGTGKLNASGCNFNSGGTDYYKGAAIGGYYRKMGSDPDATTSQCGKIFIHGGIITASSYSSIGSFDDAAGIGGWGVNGASNGPRELTVYGGKVTATGGKYSAGIGGGGINGNGGTVNIYGGEVIANGGAGDGANGLYGAARGIGGGSTLQHNTATGGPDHGTLTVDPNVVYVYGDNDDPDQLNKYEDVTYRFRYMKTDRIYGLTFAGTAVTASNASNINSVSTGTASFYPTTNTLSLNNFTKTSGNAAFVSTLDNLIVEFNGSNVLGANSGSAGYIKSNKAAATLTFKGGAATSTLELHGGATGGSVVEGFNLVQYDGAYWNYSGPITYDTSSSKYVNEWGDLNLLTITTTPQYQVWIESTQVAENNCEHIKGVGDKSVTYDDGTKTLTLDGCDILSMDGIVSALPVLNIKLKGHNSVGTYNSGRSPIVSSLSTAQLNIEKDDPNKNCSLILTTQGNDPVVKGFGSVNCSDFELVATVGSGNLNDNTLHGAILRFIKFSGGTGSSSDPYLIASKEDIQDLATIVNSNILDTSGKYFKVSSDNIDCSGLTNFTPIGLDENTPFMGTFNGDGKTISNLQVKAKYAGLFGSVYNGTISNLTLQNFKSIADNEYGTGYAGTIAGTVEGTSSNISNNMVTGTSTTVSVLTSNGTNYGYAGAIFGDYKEGTLLNNYYEYAVKVTDYDNVAKEGYTPRGNGVSGADIAASNGAVLYTQTLSTAAITNGTIVAWYPSSNTYTDNGKFIPGQTAYFKVTPSTGYAIVPSTAKVTYTIAGDSQEITGSLDANNSGNGAYVYSFTMPDAADATATATIAVDISAALYHVSIDNATYSPTASMTPTKVTLTPKGGSPITLDSDKNEFTITAKTFNGTAADFTKAGTYKVTIQGNGNYTGTRSDIDYTILPKSAAGLSVTVDGTYYYTGSDVQPPSTSIIVKDGTKTLENITDYTISYDANFNAGTAQVIITGSGNYDANTYTAQPFTILPKSIAGAVITLVDPSPAFNNTTQVPVIQSVYDGNVPLILNTDYTVKSNAGGKDVGPYEVTIQGTGNYDVNTTVSTTFTITAMNATPDVQVATTPAIVYDGNEKKPAVTVTVAGVQLTTDDYTVAYSDNINAGTNTAKATVTLKRNYSGSAVKNFTIDQREVALEWSNTEFTYDGREHKPTAKVTNLAKTTDVCDVTVNGGQTNAGPSYTATAANLNNNNYTLPNPAPTTNFKINPKSMTDNSIGVSVSGTYAYDGSPKTPTLSVTDGGNAIAAANYTVKYQQNDNGNLTDVTEMINAGSYKIVVTGKGNYKDDKSIDFTITVMNATPDVQVATTPTIVYDGTEKQPAVTVIVAGVQLTTDDYTVAYSDNVNAGTNTAKATVTLKRNYSGSAVKNFTIGQRVVTLDWTNLSFDYDGDEHVPTATVSNKVGSDVCTVTVTGGQTNAGNNYIATASGLSNNNYTLSTATTLTTNFTINPREVTLTWSNTEFTYDGQEHKPMATVTNLVKTDACNVTVTGGQTNAGNYTATASALDNTNYKLPTPNPTTTFTIKDRTANITFNAGQKYKTFYSAGENLLVPDNVKAYVVTSVTGNTVNITQISYIHANAPVLLESSSGATTVKDPNESLPTNLLKYASAGVNTNGKQYVLYSGEFVKATGTIPVGRVYLELPSSSARTLVISTDNTTAIDASFKDDADGEEKWYDMQGRQINKPTKAGLYIKNGQKVVIKNK